MANVAPRNAERVGTGSVGLVALVASLTPEVIDAGIPARAIALVTPDGRSGPRPDPTLSARRALRQAGIIPVDETKSTTEAAPTQSTSQSTAMPGSGSAMRARPRGMSGETRSATASSATAPPQAMSITLTIATAT